MCLLLPMMISLSLIFSATLHVGHPSILYLSQKISDMTLLHIKIGYLVLISKQILKFTFISCKKSYLHIFKIRSRLSRIISYMLLYLFLLNFLLIAIVNPSLLNPGPNSLRVCFQNAQGLIPFGELGSPQPSLDETKIYELNSYINHNKPDIVMLNETWLTKSISDNDVIKGENYKIYRNDRTRTSHPADPNDPKKFRTYGGGVLIAVRQDIKAEFKRLSIRKGAEILAIELTIDGNKFVFCTVYRVGNLGEPNHDSIMSSLKTFYKIRNPRKIFVVGDFNLKGISWPLSEDNEPTNGTEKLFVDSFYELGLEQCNTEPTHIKGRTLDLLLTNCKDLILNRSISCDKDLCKSDHYLVTFDIKTNITYSKQPKRKILNFKKANWGALRNDLENIHWNAVLDYLEPELGWYVFKKILLSYVYKHIPVISVKSSFSAPWFDSECYEAYRDKERAHKKFKQAINNVNDDISNTNRLQCEINFKHKRYQFKNMCNQKTRDNLYNEDDSELITKKFWSHVKSTSKSCRLPETIHYNNRFRNKASEKASLFNCYFYEQFSCPSNYNIDIDWSSDSNFDIDFCHNRVKKLLANINPNKACGPDGIHGQILKNCADSIASPLSLLFKISYNTGCLPKEWKLANVVPVHKKGAKDDVENYRPISLTSLVMKVFERILKEELLNKTSHLLNNRQHGFLSLKSCTTNMIYFTDNVALSINDIHTLSIDVIYFDFSKAFDSVNHDIILHKLKNLYAIDGRLLKFFKSYLSDREQCVVLDGIKSPYKSVLSGVPQGSILGPILFVLFINDIHNGLDPSTNIALYADDTKLWRCIRNDSDIGILQNDIDNLHNWSINNKMNFHPNKCKVVSIKHRPSPLAMLPFVAYHYYLSDNMLSYADSERDLGVYINKTFNFNEHCEKLLSKANQQYGILKRTCHFVNDQKRRRVLYLTLVRSHFEHCSQIWRPTGSTMIRKFDNFQKKCLKWVLNEEEVSYSNEMYLQKCKQVNLFPFLYKFNLNDMILFHKIFYGNIPSSMPDYLSVFNGQTRLRKCHLDNFSLVSSISSRTTSSHYLNKSFFFRSHSLWNLVPLEIRKIQDLSNFKSKLTKYYWDQVSIEMVNNLDNYLDSESEISDDGG